MGRRKLPNGFAAGCEAWLCLAVSGSLMTWAAPLVLKPGVNEMR